VIHAVGVLFKGSGFYKTDNRAKPAASEAEGGAKESDSTGDKVADAPAKDAEATPKDSKKLKTPAAAASTSEE